jgi:hypothetical protein
MRARNSWNFLEASPVVFSAAGTAGLTQNRGVGFNPCGRSKSLPDSASLGIPGNFQINAAVNANFFEGQEQLLGKLVAI